MSADPEEMFRDLGYGRPIEGLRPGASNPDRNSESQRPHPAVHRGEVYAAQEVRAQHETTPDDRDVKKFGLHVF